MKFFLELKNDSMFLMQFLKMVRRHVMRLQFTSPLLFIRKLTIERCRFSRFSYFVVAVAIKILVQPWWFIQKVLLTKKHPCRSRGLYSSEAVSSPGPVNQQSSLYLTYLTPLCWFTAIFLVIGCSSIQVNTDFDPTADFSTIRTYGWKKVKVQDDALADNPLLYKRIAAAVDEYLSKRGYHKTNPESADVLVVLRAGVKEKMRITSLGRHDDYVPGSWYRPWHGYQNRQDIVSYYTEGTLVLDIVDRRKNELIWRGIGTDIIHRYSDRQKEKKVIDGYVQKILDQFPPGNKMK